MILELEDPLDGPVEGGLLEDDIGRPDHGVLFQLVAQLLGKVSHAIETVRSMFVNPLEEIASLKGLVPHLRHEGFHALPVKVQKIEFAVSHDRRSARAFANAPYHPRPALLL